MRQLISFLLIAVCASELISDIVPADDFAKFQLSIGDLGGCSNETHRWSPFNGSCFDETSGSIPYNPPASKSNKLADFISSFVGLRPRDGLCGPQETTCWIVNCCQPGETCGPINIGCQVSWSTIYTTTITTLWSTVTSWVVPHTSAVEYTTVTVNSTTYMTTFIGITLPGQGLDQVIQTSVIETASLILSAYTPPTVTATKTITKDNTIPPVTPAPRLMVRETGKLLLRADIPRRSERTSYTTLTVFVTTFFTTSVTATLLNTVIEVTETSTISSLATRNQTHYETPTGFTTTTITVTSTSLSYAYGSVAAPTRVVYITTIPSQSAVAIAPSGTDISNTASSSEPGISKVPRSRRLSAGAIAGIVIGVILILVLLCLAIGLLYFRRQKKRQDDEYASRRDAFDETPSPPAAPSPKPAMATISQTEITTPQNGGSDFPVSPMSELFFSGLNMMDRGPYPPHDSINANGIIGGSSSSRHSRRGSRGSVVSAILPVPEEDDEDVDKISPVVHTGNNASPKRRVGTDRAWGRGYGGRGGYNSGYANSNNNHDKNASVNRDDETGLPSVNPAFSGVITSSYNEGGLVPPHARDHGFRF
ncbi:hypothetical protein TWF694_003853 [Orbilia ellipsospora]|uniref:Mid2 domain-containing protein n=1 Tax=Orbilia ellipsospora TaxID=2528407 RepID=A0AAV9WZH2_9PEZI